MFEKENDLKALYAETNEDWHGTLDRRFFRPPFHTSHPLQECTDRGREDYQLSLLDRKS